MGMCALSQSICRLNWLILTDNSDNSKKLERQRADGCKSHQLRPHSLSELYYTWRLA